MLYYEKKCAGRYRLMKFYRNLYVGSTVTDVNRVKRKLKMNAGQISVFVIALCKSRDQLEIYHCALLQQRYYKKNPPYIIGIANGYEEALEIVKQIVEETYRQNGDCDLKKYLLDKK